MKALSNRQFLVIAAAAVFASCGGSAAPNPAPPSAASEPSTAKDAPPAEPAVNDASATKTQQRGGAVQVKESAQEPFRPLTREEFAAARKAAEAEARGSIDKAAVAACATQPTTTTDEQVAAATCYQDAGHIGLAIRLWTQVRQNGGPPHREQAAAHLGPLWEKAGRFSDAAHAYFELGAKYGRNDKAVDALIRATCMYRQLGSEREAKRAFKILERTQRRAKTVSYDRLCDDVRPIAP